LTWWWCLLLWLFQVDALEPVFWSCESATESVDSMEEMLPLLQGHKHDPTTRPKEPKTDGNINSRIKLSINPSSLRKRASLKMITEGVGSTHPPC
jgi:hypothetical protein